MQHAPDCLIKQRRGQFRLEGGRCNGKCSGLDVLSEMRQVELQTGLMDSAGQKPDLWICSFLWVGAW
jgi:hypothetical protein